MKHILYGALLMMGSLGAHAQVQIGLTGSANYAAVEIDEIGSAFTDVIAGNNITGYELGLSSRVQWGGFYVRPTAVFNQNFGQVSYNERGSDGSENRRTQDFQYSQLTVPFLMGLQLIGPTCIEAGPVYHYVTNYTSNYNSNALSFNRNGLGYRIGGGLYFNRWMLTVTYEGTTYDMGRDATASFSVPYKLLFNITLFLNDGDGAEDK